MQSRVRESRRNGGPITNSLEIPDDGGAISAGRDAGAVVGVDLDGGHLALVLLHVGHEVTATSAHNVVLKDLPHAHLQCTQKGGPSAQLTLVRFHLTWTLGSPESDSNQFIKLFFLQIKQTDDL